MHVSVHCRMSPTRGLLRQANDKVVWLIRGNPSFGGRSEPCRLGPTSSEFYGPAVVLAADCCCKTLYQAHAIPIRAKAPRLLVQRCATDPYRRALRDVQKVRQPSLIVHGVKDIVVEPVNAVVLDENLSDARLLMLPANSNGAQSQPITSFGEACAIRMCWAVEGLTALRFHFLHGQAHQMANVANVKAKSPAPTWSSASMWANSHAAMPNATMNVRSKSNSKGVATQCRSCGSRPDIGRQAMRRWPADCRLRLHLTHLQTSFPC